MMKVFNNSKECLMEQKLKQIMMGHISDNYYLCLPGLRDQSKIWSAVKEVYDRCRYPGEDIETSYSNTERTGWYVRVVRNESPQLSWQITLSADEISRARSAYYEKHQ